MQEPKISEYIELYERLKPLSIQELKQKRWNTKDYVVARLILDLIEEKLAFKPRTFMINPNP